MPAGRMAGTADLRSRRLQPGPDRAVASPDEDHLGPLLENGRHSGLDPAGLLDLVPDRIDDPGAVEHLAQFAEAAAHRLADVGDDRHAPPRCG